MIFTAILMFVLALTGMLLFDLKIPVGILMILCAAGVLANELLLKKIIQKKYIHFLIFGVLTTAFLACALLPGPREAAVPAEPAEDMPSVVRGMQNGTTESGDDETYFKAAREHIEREEYDHAEQALSGLSEKARRSEAYFILISDVKAGQNGAERCMDQNFLNFLMDAVREHPDSLILNYKTGIAAYALERYITAESYLTRAFELAPENDPYTPYALAAVYKHLGEDAYAYAFMTIAEKNGMLDSGECDGEGIVDWYREFKEERKETEGAK